MFINYNKLEKGRPNTDVKAHLHGIADKVEKDLHTITRQS